jgi:hypothetical protein
MPERKTREPKIVPDSTPAESSPAVVESSPEAKMEVALPEKTAEELLRDARANVQAPLTLEERVKALEDKAGGMKTYRNM